VKYYKISEKDLKCLLSRSKKLFLVARDIRDGAEDVSEDELLRLYEPLQKEDSGMPAEMTLRDFLKTVDPSEEIIFKALGDDSLHNGTATPSKLLEDPGFAGYLSLKVQSIASVIGKEGNAVLSVELTKGSEKESEHQITFRDFLSVIPQDNEVFFYICSRKHIRPICDGNAYRDQILTESGYSMFLGMTGLNIYPGEDLFGNPTLKVRIFNFYD
jgi:hypothetical protein